MVRYFCFKYFFFLPDKWLFLSQYCTSFDFRNNFGNLEKGDFLSIFDGDSNISPKLDTYCGNLGNSLPPSQISSSNHLFFHFQSDYIYTGTGFKLEYNATSKITYKVLCVEKRDKKIWRIEKFIILF